MITLYIFQTPVRIKAMALVNVIAIWIITAWVSLWMRPERFLWEGVLVGLLATFLLLIADFGHALAHIFSARRANAPMDEVQISSGMPRTLYHDHDVAPETHRTRALGGPIFSALGLLLSLVVFTVSAEGSVVRELAGWSALGHGFILAGSLLPLPFVDGGSLYKWTLVINGRSEAEADRLIRSANWLLGVLGIGIGLILLALQIWLGALVAVGVGAVVLGAAAGKIR